MMRTIEIASLDDLERASAQFLETARDHKKFAFHGAMGSGKTTLIKEVCKLLGATDSVTSPTFSLVNEYNTPQGATLYHFDLYRINTMEELFDLGYEEYFFGDSYIFVEWAEKAESLLPDTFVDVYLDETGPGSRQVRIDL
jgi:tRNA threonylcarbamoyladenosine biosynthesis protein TsaE